MLRRTPTIDRISPHPLWVGHAGDGRDFARLHDLGIEAVVQLAVEEPPLTPPRSLIYHRFPLLDGTGNAPAYLELAIGTIAELIRLGIPTLVCCGMGLSRSPAITATALARLEGVPPDDALRALADHHRMDISPGLWREVRMNGPAPEGGVAPRRL